MPQGRVGRNDRNEEGAVVDLVPDLLIPGVPAPELALIEKDFDTARTRRHGKSFGPPSHPLRRSSERPRAKSRSRYAATLDHIEHPPMRRKWSRTPTGLATRLGFRARTGCFRAAFSRNWRTAPGPVPAGRWYLKGGNRLGLYAVVPAGRRIQRRGVGGLAVAALGERPVALVSSPRIGPESGADPSRPCGPSATQSRQARPAP
jgi:hypothetical protein